ncbi:MFS transporter [Rhodoplanes sp. Z2-YC6860]|uniref:MFS transporter n=1 Tax=Rhodoplanes sp. Z2-YC6860 TaxID=674703 RepID=UPI00078D05C4|nr:MFS transporter [Rhodoplanes sp. Z2-YC6860]AMN41584.1 major facilitator transporter [Rhodoplanes sp. Z2-YC6860]
MEVKNTRWSIVAALILTGMIAALQVGKVAIALPQLQQDFKLSLFVAASAIGAYSVLGAALGMPVGILTTFVSARRAMIAGLVVAAIGSFLGAASTNGAFLVAARVVEGCGFLTTVLVIPSLLRRAAAPRDLDTILSLWAAYLPSGAAIMMLVGPTVLEQGWRMLWLGNGALCLAAAMLLFFLALPDVAAQPGGRRFGNAGIVLRSKAALLLATTFGLYTFQFMAMAGLLPTLLIERAGLSVATAGMITALTWVANAAGNASAGLLLRAGVPMWTVPLGAFSLMGVAAFGIFSAGLSLTTVVILACTSLGLTGLIPGSVFAAAPRVAPAMLVLTLGLINQGSNVGSLLGPAVLGSLVQHFGWDSAWILFAAIALCGIAAALGLRVALGKVG